MMDHSVGREEVLAAHPLLAHVESTGAKIRASGNDRVTNLCPKVQHRKDHFCVSINMEKEVWCCHDCGVGGSVIDWIAISSGRNPIEVFKELAIAIQPQSSAPPDERKSKLIKTYDYTDPQGNLLYQVCRYEPKTFRQRQPDNGGGWKWTMEGATRVPYRLPEVLNAQTVICAEGEKDCDTLGELGFVATCNVGGAEKWLDAYSDFLKDKDVIIVPDNDDKGKKHADIIVESLKEKANSIKVVSVPKPSKDATDYVKTFKTSDEAKAALNSLFDKSPHTVSPIPIYTMEEMERQYMKFQRSDHPVQLSLGGFLPTLGTRVRPMLPGELVFILASTGVGKTVIAQAIAKSSRPLATLFFELELPMELLFERFSQMANNCESKQVESYYKSIAKPVVGGYADWNHVLVCPESGLSPDKIENYIRRSALKFGRPASVVIVDYLGLLRVKSNSRYETVSYCAEALRVVAKNTGTIIVVTVQIARPEKKSESLEVGLYDGKDSGSIECSASLVLGVWRPERDTMIVKVLKNTKGTTGHEIECNFDGARMSITEKSKISDSDVPML